MSTSYSSPYQLTEDLLKTYKQMEKTEQTVPNPKPNPKPREDKNRAIKPQDKTGAYGEKRKPGDYLK
ncbi:Uncharacterised protein [Chlamydia trachomatis]|nr:Uncharacterised protein [Chlamydia trachomatis]